MNDKVIIIMDSGINRLEFKDYVVGGIRFFIKDKYICCDNKFDDDNGHGSACAAIIKYIVPDTKFFVVKILDSNLEANCQILEAALEFCLGLKYHIINLSLSLVDGGEDSRLNDLCNKLKNGGKIIVSSVCNGKCKSYPAAYSSVIGVRGCCFGDLEEYWYNSKSEIQCVADILPAFTSRSSDRYILFGGNSKACAVLSGMILKMENDHKVDLNFESASVLLEARSRKVDWIENDINSLMEAYEQDTTPLCNERILKIVHKISSTAMEWDNDVEVGWKDNLFERGLFYADKMNSLISSLEKRFGITIPDSCLKYDSFISINKIGKIIEGELNEEVEAYI